MRAPWMIGGVLAGLLCVAAWGQTRANEPTQLERQFLSLDKDRSGTLTAQELPNRELFSKMDRNNDGVVTLGEFREYTEYLNERSFPSTSGGNSLEERFRLMDRNGDGRLSPQEMQDAALFARLDTNKDGFVTLAEARAGAPGTTPPATSTLEQQFRAYDKNGDGMLSQREFPYPELFARLDTNRDGQLTLDEMRAGYGRPGENPGATDPNKPEPTLEERFTGADKDRDGKLNPAEVGNTEMFTKLDTNKDGFVSLAELQAYAKGQTAPQTPATDPRNAMPVEQQFKMRDFDNDGKLSAVELPFPELFAKLDLNKDGFVTLEEAKAAAAQEHPPIEVRFKQFDKNNDGKLTADEVGNTELFAKMDANKDGFVTLEEAKAAEAKAAEAKPTTPVAAPAEDSAFVRYFKHYDKDGDGKLAAADVPDAALFARLDLNRDGIATLEEARNVAPAQKPEERPMTLEERFALLDLNKDGKLSVQELGQPELLPKLDTNRDGFVSLEEAKAAVVPLPGR